MTEMLLGQSSPRRVGSLGETMHQRHRAVGFRKFLSEVEQAVPSDLDIHLVLDNYATHKAPPVKAWLTRDPRPRPAPPG